MVSREDARMSGRGTPESTLAGCEQDLQALPRLFSAAPTPSPEPEDPEFLPGDLLPGQVLQFVVDPVGGGA